MPRNGKGGARQGAPGQAYGNRTDLNNRMPVEVAQNQTYGKAAEQRAAQGAVPMGSTPVAATPQAPQAPQSETIMGNMPQRQAPVVAPGTSPFLDATNRPSEPITAGLPIGPGPGPEALGRPQNAISQALGSLAAMPGASSAVMDLAATARMMGL